MTNDEKYRAQRVTENAIEIALDCFQEIYDKTDLPRDIVIGEIQKWAEEAEQLWEQGNHTYNYLDFIDDFIAKRKQKYFEENKASLLE